MSVNCEVCGGEIPRSLIRWCSDKTGTPEELWEKGYVSANIENMREMIRAEYYVAGEDVQRALQTRLSLWKGNDLNGDYPICWTCAGKAKRKCYGCGEIFTGHVEYYKKPWEYITLYHDTTWDCGYGEYRWFFCNKGHCLEYRSFMKGEYKYPGYTKAIEKAREIFRTCDVDTARLYITSQLVEYNISEFKKAAK